MKITLVAICDLYSYGIRGLHATLNKGGHEVKSIFFKTSAYNIIRPTDHEINRLVELIVATEPQLIGIAIRSPMFQIYKTLSVKLRKLTQAKILVGGHHATADPKSLLPYADFICMGEGEEAIRELCAQQPLRAVKGIYPNPSALEIQDLDTLEFDYYGDQCIYYMANEPANETQMSIYSSRGCFFNCSFCFEDVLRKYCPHHKVRRKSVGRVMQEIRRYREMFPKLKEIVFSDMVFTYNDRWINKFCEEFSKTDLIFRCFGHTSLATEGMLKTMRDAGLNYVTFGVESGSLQCRKIYNRTEPLAKTIELSKITAGLGIKARFDFIVNSPFETVEGWQDTKKLIHQLSRPCVIRNFELRFFPATTITEYALEQGIITEENIEGNTGCKFGSWSYNYELSRS